MTFPEELDKRAWRTIAEVMVWLACWVLVFWVLIKWTWPWTLWAFMVFLAGFSLGHWAARWKRRVDAISEELKKQREIERGG